MTPEAKLAGRSSLPVIPLLDIRSGGTLRHAEESRARARALRDDCLGFFPSAVAKMIPVLDKLARRWLKRSRSPYIAEIEAIAATLAFPGVWFLNGSYQWGCTALARDEDGSPWLARTLDWPFPGLGRHVEIAHMQGQAGEFFNVTWPGYVGALNAMAPGRFAACVNQAPLLRRTNHHWLRLYDIAANAVNTWARVRHIPPDQLLRQVFETSSDFAAAKARLEQTPVARPVIFTLVGCAPDERCVIERTEETYRTRGDDTVAANDWSERQSGWEARIAARHMFNLSSDQAAENSRSRRDALGRWSGALVAEGFEWVAPPVLNPYTRVALSMCPERGTLSLCGYEASPDRDLAEPVTQVRTLAPIRKPGEADESSLHATAVS
jgi:hypothetical protein